MNDQRAQAPHRAYPGLAIQFHGLLRNPSPVAAVTVLNFLHAGLQLAHSPHLANLLKGQGQSNQAYQNGENYNCDPHVVKADYIQHHKGVEHGADYNFIPKEEEKLQGDS